MFFSISQLARFTFAIVCSVSAMGLVACASRSVMPESKEVKVGREEAGDGCKEIGTISGTTISAKGTREEAIADLKQEAANKGANYVMIKQFSGNGTTATGVAYECE